MRHSLITNLTLLIRGGCQLVPDIRHGTDFIFDRVFSPGDDPAFVKTNITTK